MGGSEAGRQAGTIERRSGWEAGRKSNMVFEAKTNAGEWGRTFNIGKRLLRR